MSGLNVYRTDIWVLIITGQLFREGFLPVRSSSRLILHLLRLPVLVVSYVLHRNGVLRRLSLFTTHSGRVSV